MTKKLIVKGIVQGVGFRYRTKQLAEQMGITGTIKNLQDGSVEIYCTGTSEQLKLFINKISMGYAYAKVESVIVSDLPSVDYLHFNVIY